MKRAVDRLYPHIDERRIHRSLDTRFNLVCRDLVIKKMIYLYLTNYARTHPELAQMCTNTLTKDCANDDPMVRGLALRALCGLNLPQMVEYISEPLRRSLSDGHAYVRKTAVMGVLKLYHLDRDTFESCGFVDILYDMLRDPDASVVVNCVICLNEVMQKSPAGGMAINRAIMLHLLNRIHEFNEFAKVQILELVPRYIPANEEEGYQIMNLLDPVLSTSGSGAVMATVRAFLSLSEQVVGDDEHKMQMKRQIVERVKPSLVTQISSGSSEMMYTLLKHVETLAEACPGVFDDEYRQFYVRYNEPTHVKYLKLSVLPRLANPDTAPDIVSELAECVHDANVKMSRLAVRSMARIACGGSGGPGAAEAIARRLLELLDLNVEHVSSEAASALTLIVRKHPTLKPMVAPPLTRSLKYITEPSGRASVLYLLGDCGDIVPTAPYALEKLIDSYDSLEDVGVKLALLTTTMKLFLQQNRAPEVQRMLGRLLAKACDDVSSQDLHDRALQYYRLLRNTDLHTLQTTIPQLKANFVPEHIPFAEEDDSARQKLLMEEFNTLSVMYGKPSVHFIAPEYQVKYVKMPAEHPLSPGAPPAQELETSAPQGSQPLAAVAQNNADVDLLGFGDGPPPSHVASVAPPASSLALNPSVSLSGDDYQSRWEGISDNDAHVSAIPVGMAHVTTESVEAALANIHVRTIASGELPTEFKFFLYAQEVTSGMLFLIQGNIDKHSAEPLMITTIKVTGDMASSEWIRQLTEAFATALQ